MNKTYRIVWSEIRKAFVVADERAKAKGKPSSSRKAVAQAVVGALLALSGAGQALAAPGSTALPTNGVVASGTASIGVNGSAMTINQATQSTVINWGTFNIGSAASVDFIQPNSSSTSLNRVQSANPSQIYGSLTSNGIIFLVNPQGIVVGPGAQVNVGGLVASSLNISDADFLANKFNFQASGTPGSVSNAGTINVAPGGFAALIGGQVNNSGLISAKLGSVALASGNQVALNLDDTGMLSVGVEQGAINALVQNSGAIIADGGRIIMTAKSANALLDTVVNNEGILQSQSIGMRNGQIWMLASDPLSNTGATGAAANGGAVQNAAGGVVSSGTIDVSSNTGASSGQVTIAGSTVDVSGTIKAGSATSGGGQVLINSTSGTTVDVGGVIDVSSAAGSGSAILWSAGETAFHGTVNGQGLGAVGHGATVEISASNSDTIDGAVNIGAQSAANSGTFLVDPPTLTLEIGGNGLSQSTLENIAGAIVLSADGQITIDPLTNNVLNLSNATSFSLTSNSTGGIQFLNGLNGPSGISTNGAAVTLTASGNGSLLNVGQITTHGGAISLSGIAVQLGAGLDASTAGNNGANGGNVDISIFGGGILGSGSNGIIAGSSVTLDATYGYIGTSASPVATSTSELTLLTGGDAYVTDASSLTTLTLSSNHLMGSPVGISVNAPNLLLTGQDATGDGTLYDASVKWVSYSASNNGAGSGPVAVSITQDANLLPWAINLPSTNVTLISENADILGGNSTPLTASSLVLRSPFAIGGINASGNVDSFINGNASDGLPLATQATTVDAQVLNSAGAIANGGIISLDQTGDLAGDASATYINLNASGSIGSSGTPFAMNFDGSSSSSYLQIYSNSNGANYQTNAYLSNVTAGNSVYVNASFNGSLAPIAFQNVTATSGSITFNLTDTCGGCYSPFVTNISSPGAINLAGYSVGGLYVSNASSNTSINISTDASSPGWGTLEVDNAVLIGTDNVNRYITLTSENGSVVAANLSTDGDVASTAAAPLGTINLSAPHGTINSLYQDYGGAPGTLRAGTANILAGYGINFYSNVDTSTLLNLTVGQGVGSYESAVNFYATGVDAVTDPTGINPHPVQINSATDVNSVYGYINISNSNGGLKIGQVRASSSYGGSSISLSANNGPIIAAAGGGIIKAQSSYGGRTINLSSTGANGGLGVAGGLPLSLSGNNIYLTTSGDMNVTNDQYYLNYLQLNLIYANNAGPNTYSFLSGASTTPDPVNNSVNFLASAPGTTASAPNNNVLTVANTTLNGNGLNQLNFYGDGDLAINGVTNSAYSYFSANNITIGDPNSSTPGVINTSRTFGAYANDSLTAGTIQADNSYIDLEAYSGNLSVNNISSVQNPGQAAQNAQVYLYTSQGSITANTILTSGSSVQLNASGGGINVGVIQDAGNTVTLNDYSGGDILGLNSSNLITADTLNLNNQTGNIGSAAIPLNLAVASYLNISNQPGYSGGGGGSIYITTSNDPANLNLYLSSNLANSTYATSTYSIAPNATSNPDGLTLSGTSDLTGLTISNIGIQGVAPATQVSNVSILADAPIISITSGAKTTAPVSYSLTPGVNGNFGVDSANASATVNLTGGAGGLVTLNLDNVYTSNNISGNLELADLTINSNSNSGNSSTPVTANFTLISPLNNFILNRTGDSVSPDSYTFTDGGSTGQSFSAANSSGTFSVAAANTNTANPLSLAFNVSGLPIEFQANSISLTNNDSISLSAYQILGGAGNQLTAGSVFLSATGSYGSTLGTAGQVINVAAADVSLTSAGNINVNIDNSSITNAPTLSALNINVSHPAGYDANGNYHLPFYLSTYNITGDVTLTATDVTQNDTTLGLNASNLNFSFTTDRNLIVGDSTNLGINNPGGSVTLTANGNYRSRGCDSFTCYGDDFAPIGIEQSTVSGATGITADQVSLNANGYLGHVGLGGTPLLVTTPSLSINVDGSLNVADSLPLTTLALTLSHGRDYNGYVPGNSYAITDGGDLALTLYDHVTNGNCYICYNSDNIQLANLTSSNLVNFSLNSTTNGLAMVVGNFGWNSNTSTYDFSAGQINLSHSGSTVSLTSAGSIYFDSNNLYENPLGNIGDSPSSSIASTNAAIVANTLNLSANGDIAGTRWYWYDYTNSPLGDALPTMVNNLSVTNGQNSVDYISNIGSINITGTQVGTASLYVQALASGGSATITETAGTAITAKRTSSYGGVITNNYGAITLVANYGSLGSSSTPLITDTDNLSLQSGGDIYVGNQSLLNYLAITSYHNKTITDPASSGLNTIVVSDNILASGTPLQLGITDTTLSTSYGTGNYIPANNVYQYQMDGLNEPNLNFSFTSDSGMSAGTLLASSISLTSMNGSILAYQGGVNGVNGTITAPNGVSLWVQSQGQSIGAPGTPVLIDSSFVSFTTGGNLVVKDSAVIDTLSLGTYTVADVNSVVPVYTIDNSAAPAGHQITFDVTGDPTFGSTGILNVNNITLASGNPGDSVSVSSKYSDVGVKAINVPGAGANIYVSSNQASLVGLANATGMVADNVSLSVGNWGSSQNIGLSSAPMLVDTINLSVSTNTSGGGDTYVNFVASPTRQLSGVNISENSISSSNTLAIVDNSIFSLSGGDNGAGSFSLTNVSGTDINLSFSTYSDFHIGTINLGSGNLSLSSYYNSINADNGSTGAPNIVTTGNVNLSAEYDVGNNSTTAIYTNIAGNVSLNATYGNINLNQVAANTPLNITNIGTYIWGSGAVNLTSAGAMNLPGFSVGNGGLTLTAGTDLNYYGSIYLNHSNVSMTSTGGSIYANGNGIYGAYGASLTAAQNISVSAIDTNNYGYYWGPATNAITLTATAGNVDLTGGSLVSSNSVNITAGGYIHSEGGDFSLTPVVNLQAGSDIGYYQWWSGLSTWNLNSNNDWYSYNNNPDTLTLSAVSTAGAVNLASYAGVNVTRLSGANDVSLQVYGDYQVPNAGIMVGADTSGTGAGTISSATGSVYLSTNDGNITGAAGNLIKAGGSITLWANQNLYDNNNGAYASDGTGGTYGSTVYSPVYNIGYDGTNIVPLSLNAQAINLVANGNIYATLPATGVTDISVGRTYVVMQSYNNWSQLGVSMPGGTIQINDTDSYPIVSIADTGVNGFSTVAVNYGTALNFTYNSYDTIQLGSINLTGSSATGGNLTLGISNPFNVAITSAGSSISGGQITFNLYPTYDYNLQTVDATGGFGTLANPINTQVNSISGTTTGSTAGFYVNQTGAITLDNLQTGGGIGVTSTGNITLLGNVGSTNSGDVNLNAGTSAIVTTNGQTPNISANSGDVILAGASINLPNSTITSSNGNVSLTANTGALTLTGSSVTSNGSTGTTLTASAGTMDLSNSSINANNGGSATISLAVGSLDLSTASIYASSTVNVTTAQDITIGSIYGGGAVTLTATNGVIQGTTNSVGITGSTVALNAATGIGTLTPVMVEGGNGNTITATTTSGDVHLEMGGQGDNQSSAILNVSTGAGAIGITNNYGTLELASVVSSGNGPTSLGDISVVNQVNNSSIQIDTVSALGAGALVSLKAPSGSIFDDYLGTGITASRIAINALGLNAKGQGGSIYSGGSPSATVNGDTVSGVQVDGQAVVAVASGDISLYSTNTSLSQMPLVASNGDAQTISIISAGDFQVGQIVAGLNAGTVNINSAGSIFDDGNPTTWIQTGIANLTAANAIGTGADPISIAAHDYGANAPGVILAASAGVGNIYINQTGDVTLQSLTTANGSINVNVAGNTFVNYADASAIDATGNNVNITLSSGDMTVSQAVAGATNGAVNLTATTGSILGDADYTGPHVIANAANMVAQNNIGYNGTDNTQILHANTTQPSHVNPTQTLYVDANVISTSTTANNASTVIYLEQGDGGNAALNSSTSTFSATGASSTINVQSFGNLDLTSMASAPSWLTVGAGSNVVFGAGYNLLLPNTLDTTNNTSINSLTLIGGNDVLAPNNGTTPHTLTIKTANLLLETGAAGSTGAAGTADSLIVNATGQAADVVVTGLTATDLAINTDNQTVISALNNNGNVIIGMTGTGSLNIYSVNTPNYSVTLNAPSGGIAQVSQDNLGYFTTPGVNSYGITFNVLHGIGSAAIPLDLAVNEVGANISSDGGIYLTVTPPTGTTTITGMTTYNGDIIVTSNGALTVSDAIQAGTNGSGNVALGATTGDINLDNAVSATGGVTIVATSGSIIDGYGSAATPTIAAQTVGLIASGSIGGSGDSTPLWVNADTITAQSGGTMTISDTSTSPVTLQSLVALNGAINVNTASSTFVNYADASATDAAGNNVNITASSGDMTVNQALAGATQGVVNLTATTGSILGDAYDSATGLLPRDCCTDPHVIGSAANLVAQNNIGDNMHAVSIDAGAVTTSTTAANASTILYLTGSDTVALNGSSTFSATGAASTVEIRSCTNLDLTGMGTAPGWLTVGAGSNVLFGAGNNLLLPNTLDTTNNTAIASLTLIGMNDVYAPNNGDAQHTLTIKTNNLLLETGAAGVTALDPLIVNATGQAADIVTVGSTLTDLAVNTDNQTIISAFNNNGNVTVGTTDTGNLNVYSVTSADTVTLNAAGNIAQASQDNLGYFITPGLYANAVNLTAAGSIGATTPLMVNTGSITATSGGVLAITDTSTNPVLIASVNSNGYAVTIDAAATIDMNKINAGAGDVTITSETGAINDADLQTSLSNLNGHASLSNWNIYSTGTVTLNAATTVGSIEDSTWVAGTQNFSGGTTPTGMSWINYVPSIIYPSEPVVPGVSNQTVYDDSASGQKQEPVPVLNLPFVMVGSPIRIKPPMEVDVTSNGMSLPDFLADIVTTQDQAFGTKPENVVGGNETELGRDKKHGAQ